MVQIIVTADTGSGQKDQYLVADAMHKFIQKHKKIGFSDFYSN